MISILIPGRALPEAKKTHPFKKKDGSLGIARHDLAPQVDYKSRVSNCMYRAMEGRPPLEGPLRLEVTFYRLRPKSAPKRVVFPATRPDLNNCVKLIEDAGNKLVWVDDGHIVTEIARKRFGETERVEVIVHAEEMTGELAFVGTEPTLAEIEEG